MPGSEGVLTPHLLSTLPRTNSIAGDLEMTAADLLRNAQPPSDDGLIEKAIAELDVKLFEWTDALKSAHAQLRSAFAVRPSSRPSQALYEGAAPMPSLPAAGAAPMPSLSAAAAAAHMPTLPPLPEWATAPAVPTEEDAPAWAEPPSHVPAPQPSPWAQPPAAAPAAPSAWAASTPAAFRDAPESSAGNEWPQPQAQSPFGGHGISSGAQTQQPDAVAWPTAPSGNWPEQPATNPSGSQAWPTWTPNDSSAGSAPKKTSVRTSRAPKAVRQTLTEGPTPEERAQKAAAEEALLSGLEDAIARRVRLLRRLDPDTGIEKLIEKARQGHAEALSAPPQQSRDDKSSWWRRK